MGFFIVYTARSCIASSMHPHCFPIVAICILLAIASNKALCSHFRKLNHLASVSCMYDSHHTHISVYHFSKLCTWHCFFYLDFCVHIECKTCFFGTYLNLKCIQPCGERQVLNNLDLTSQIVGENLLTCQRLIIT